MTLAVSHDMVTFLIMLLILVTGNIFTMQLIYPSAVQADLDLSKADRQSITDHFDGWGHAMFGSLDMLFSSNFDKELLDKAYSPGLAYCYYCWFVVLVPLIMLNLLIALMGGSCKFAGVLSLIPTPLAHST